MEVHAVVLGARLVLHEVGAILGRPERGFQGPTVDEDVVHRLYRLESVLGPVVGHIRARGRSLWKRKQMNLKNASNIGQLNRR